MTTRELFFDFYYVYDRSGDGVVAPYIVEYDWDTILESGLLEENIKVIFQPLPKSVIKYIKSIGGDPETWFQEMKTIIMDPDSYHNAITSFAESLSDKESEEYEEYAKDR